MNLKRTLLLATLSAIAFLAAGCGGGGSDSGPIISTPPPSGGIGRNGVAVGPISNFGSVIVNGVTYNTDNASFTINGAPGTQADLRVGDMVAVAGVIDENGTTGTATTVNFDDLVTGPIDSIDIANSTLVVLGQIVLITAETSFDDDFSPASIDGLTVGQVIEVSGQFNSDGEIIATSIDDDDNGEFEATGTVVNLDDTNFTFEIGGLVVDYATATLDDFPNGVITEGDFVEAEGTSIGANGELIATKVELESLLPDADDGDRIELEGFVTRFVSATDFDVAGIPVTTNSATEYEDGSVADLALNVRIEVEGDYDANGVIVATEIDFRADNKVRISARIDSVNVETDSFVVIGIPVTVSTLTRFDDKTEADDGQLNLADLMVGDFVEIRGSEDAANPGNVFAAIVEREEADPDTETELQGFVESIGTDSYVVLGVTVETDANTEYQGRDDSPLTATEFFNLVAVGSLVDADGLEISDTVLLADEVELEGDD